MVKLLGPGMCQLFFVEKKISYKAQISDPKALTLMQEARL